MAPRRKNRARAIRNQPPRRLVRTTKGSEGNPGACEDARRRNANTRKPERPERVTLPGTKLGVIGVLVILAVAALHSRPSGWPF